MSFLYPPKDVWLLIANFANCKGLLLDWLQKHDGDGSDDG